MSKQSRFKAPITTKKKTLAKLRIIWDSGQRDIPLHDPMVIGSDTSCDVQISALHVDRRHSEIYQVGCSWWVRDLGSEEGTFLDGDIIDAAPLGGASELRLGPVSHRGC